jgi:hypothetical protein
MELRVAGGAFLALLLLFALVWSLERSSELLPLRFVAAWLVALVIGVAHGAMAHGWRARNDAN